MKFRAAMYFAVLALTGQAAAQDADSGPCLSDWDPREIKVAQGERGSALVVHQGTAGSNRQTARKDFRIEAEACKDQRVQENARGTVAILVKDTDFALTGNDTKIRLKTFNKLRDYSPEVTIARGVKAKKRLCPSELFQEQARVANCSGVVVAPSVVLTAGHCAGAPDKLRILMDFKITAGRAPAEELSGDDPKLRKVVRVIQVHSRLGRNLTEVGHDIALLEVDKPFDVDRRIAIEGESGSPAPTDRLYALGFPSGLPMKLSPDGRIYNTRWYNGAPVSAEESRIFIYTDLSSFSGNSGGPVFNVATHRLEGIIRGGQEDYRLNTIEDCATSLCDAAVAEKCTRRESVTRISAIPDWALTLIRQRGGGSK